MDTESTQIRPYTLRVDEADLADLNERLAATRWPDEGPGEPWADGLPLDYAKELAIYWKGDFDWRAQEDRINAVPQFTTMIDDHPVHFFHQRSGRPGAKPLLLVRGWPSGPTDFSTCFPC